MISGGSLTRFFVFIYRMTPLTKGYDLQPLSNGRYECEIRMFIEFKKNIKSQKQYAPDCAIQ
jgi:hypothetical protein